MSTTASAIPYLHADGRFGFVGPDGQAPFAKTFEDAQPFSEGRAAVRSGGKWGYIDLRGRWIVRPRFTEARPFKDGEAWAAIVGPSTRSGFIDLNPFHSLGYRKCYLVSPDGNTRSCGGDYPDRHGETSSRIREPSLDSRQLRVVQAPDGKSAGVLGADGGQIVPFGIYDDLRYQDDVLFVVHGAGGWGILDAARNVEIVAADRPSFEQLKYTSPRLFPRLLAVQRDDGSWCVLDRTGTELHCGLSEVSHWGERLIAASNAQKQWGALDTRGQLVIPFRYDAEFRFQDQLARVRSGGREFYIDLQGHEYRAYPASD
ncbi:WG repeat-containing protein [Pseudoxanthomonas beigongshangi]